MTLGVSSTPSQDILDLFLLSRCSPERWDSLAQDGMEKHWYESFKLTYLHTSHMRRLAMGLEHWPKNTKFLSRSSAYSRCHAAPFQTVRS